MQLRMENYLSYYNVYFINIMSIDVKRDICDCNQENERKL